jgi:hypothetical protein
MNKDSLLYVTDVVGVRGLEPPTSWSQTRRASQLRHTPTSEPTVSFRKDK